MTCKEKFKEITKQDLESVKLYCPSDFKIMDDPELDMCAHKECEKCWDREVPKDIPNSHEFKETSIDTPEKFKVALDSAWTIPTIKDSGDRTQFETGAVRDMREGKGRFDISPLEAIPICS